MTSAQQRWGSGGLAWLTGPPDGPPDFSRASMLDRADTVAAGVAARLGVRLDPVVLLTGRAALAGLTRNGRVSAGGATRLLRTADGWCALTLSRADDIATVPALLCRDHVPADPWPELAGWAAGRTAAEVVERGCLLDLPVAALAESAPTTPAVRRCGDRGVPRDTRGLLVADLSSMWAGPLCGAILATAGATVVKVESPSRPDGTRSGGPGVFDWINHGKLSYAIDFGGDADRLRSLLAVADVVIEGSRPAALQRRGVTPETHRRPGRVWLRVTGHGAHADRVAFGDDAAVAGGLVGRDHTGPVFCADAVADPLTGLESALAVADSLRRGGGEVLDVAMAGVAASYAALGLTEPDPDCPVSAPGRPRIAGRGPALGADNPLVDHLIQERLSVPC